MGVRAEVGQMYGIGTIKEVRIIRSRKGLKLSIVSMLTCLLHRTILGLSIC